jgi:hypothetical protein
MYEPMTSFPLGSMFVLSMLLLSLLSSWCEITGVCFEAVLATKKFQMLELKHGAV